MFIVKGIILQEYLLYKCTADVDDRGGAKCLNGLLENYFNFIMAITIDYNYYL